MPTAYAPAHDPHYGRSREVVPWRTRSHWELRQEPNPERYVPPYWIGCTLPLPLRTPRDAGPHPAVQGPGLRCENPAEHEHSRTRTQQNTGFKNTAEHEHSRTQDTGNAGFQNAQNAERGRTWTQPLAERSRTQISQNTANAEPNRTQISQNTANAEHRQRPPRFSYAVCMPQAYTQCTLPPPPNPRSRRCVWGVEFKF